LEFRSHAARTGWSLLPRLSPFTEGGLDCATEEGGVCTPSELEYDEEVRLIEGVDSPELLSKNGESGGVTSGDCGAHSVSTGQGRGREVLWERLRTETVDTLSHLNEALADMVGEKEPVAWQEPGGRATVGAGAAFGMSRKILGQFE